MRLFALSDPHFGRDMSRYGEVWVDHEAKIRRNWRRVVTAQDLVLIPGDFSWAKTAAAVERHLDLIASLPGRAVISPGNHDRWWNHSSRLRYADIAFLNHSHLALDGDWTLAAAVGSECPESPWWKASMQEEFDLACRDLERTLGEAAAARPGARILLMLHFPPRWRVEASPTAFERIIARFPVERVVYGHIHGGDLAFAHTGWMPVEGRDIHYLNASVDRIDMTPLVVMDGFGPRA
jgi:predicted phosphohydrolase